MLSQRDIWPTASGWGKKCISSGTIDIVQRTSVGLQMRPPCFLMHLGVHSIIQRRCAAATTTYHILTGPGYMHYTSTTFRLPLSLDTRRSWKDQGSYRSSTRVLHQFNLPPFQPMWAHRSPTSVNSGASFTRSQRCTTPLRDTFTNMFLLHTPNRNFVICSNGQTDYHRSAVAMKECRIM